MSQQTHPCCLVTGGAGFIGSAVVRALLDAGWRVRIFDNLSTGSQDNLSGLDVETVWADLCDHARLSEAMAEADCVVHLAAFVSAPGSVDDPLECFTVNDWGTTLLFETARRLNCPKIVYASSAAVYGNAQRLPITESDATQPRSPYALSKLHNEQTAQLYHELCGLASIGLRFFNVYGPRQSADSPYSGVISRMADRILNRQPIVIYGNGDQTRDFVYVEDVARAVALACATPSRKAHVVNIGRGQSCSILDLARGLAEAGGWQAPIEFHPPRAGDVLHSRAATQAAMQLLGFQADIPLEKGLASLLDWMRTPVTA